MYSLAPLLAASEPQDDMDVDCVEQSSRAFKAQTVPTAHSRINNTPNQAHHLPLLFSTASPLVGENLKVREWCPPSTVIFTVTFHCASRTS